MAEITLTAVWMVVCPACGHELYRDEYGAYFCKCGTAVGVRERVHLWTPRWSRG